ncbi:MAG: efflux RND transporter periplasmic adaptor subunit [Candidatus Obscuribacterales bacterium]|nr:efflux RND transporter periplasmic adaptor subunit [Steroidobacteraceae bacterium]
MNMPSRAFSCVVLIAVAALAGCAESTSTEPTARPTSVRVAAATSGPAAPVIRTNGMLVNKDELRLSFKVGGVVSRITVQEGQRVKRGQRLAEIEQAEINAQVEQARQSADKAQRDVVRAEKLYSDRLISIGQLEDLRTQAAVSKAALQSVEFNQGYATITAPQDGTILRRLIQERELVAAGTPVLVLGAQDRGYVVRVGLADREIVQVKIGDIAEVQLDAHPDVKFAAHVTEVASGADERSGMFQVELRLAPSKLRLVSGLVARVALIPASASNTERVYVPIGAIVEGDGRKASVFVLQGDVAKRRSIDVAFIDGVNVAITQGLVAGEKVVTDGALYLQDGERVLVRDAG